MMKEWNSQKDHVYWEKRDSKHGITTGRGNNAWY
jgi:hypothetical protein